MKLIPMPRLLHQTEEIIRNKSVCFNGTAVDSRLEKAIRKLPGHPEGLPLCLRVGSGDAENYCLDVTNDGITVTADGVAGAFYALQTLRQILANEHVCACHIEDAPDFSFRGFYHDVTRGRVPTLDTLKELVDYLACMKVNSLQLYVEHTFAFSEYADSLEHTGYLTAGEIMELDAYCHENFIELIPSLSCFGHLYELLEKEQYRHLQTAKQDHPKHNRWYERMVHHTIDPLNPESFELVKSLLDQFIPLFRSDKFNICCDETFDLKNGKYEELDTGELYVGFVKKLIEYVKSRGKQVMMWGDVLHWHPERVADIPEDVVLLNWYYGPDGDTAEKMIKLFHDGNRKQIACPATWAWNHFSEFLPISIPNITHMTRLAREYGAEGILNTNWGDFGDPCSLDMSLFGIAYGAARSWNVSSEAEATAQAADLLIYDQSGACDLLRRLSEIEQTVRYGELVYLYSNLCYPDQLKIAHREEGELQKAQQACAELRQEIDAQTWKKPHFRQEMLLAAEGIQVMAELSMKLRGYAVTRQTDTEQWLGRYRTSWLEKNKESELSSIEKMFRFLDRYTGACIKG